MLEPENNVVDKVRLTWIASAIMLGFIIIGIRIVGLSTAHHIEDQGLKHHALQGERSRIVDRNGQLLAISIPTASVYANPKKISHPKQVAAQISSVMPKIKKQDLENRLQTNKQFVWVVRHATPKQQAAINALGIPGIYFMKDFYRVYPQSHLFSHVIGRVDTDSKAISGIEIYLENHPEIGKELRLSLDMRIQNILRQELIKGVAHAEGGAGIVMDANNGEVLASVSLPDFDPNKITEQNKEALFNRATLGLYEMGSTFKMFTMAAAMEAEAVELDEIIDVSQPLRIANHTIKDFQQHSTLNVREIFAKSSNIGIAKIALRIGIRPLKKFLEKLGLFAPLKIEIPEKSVPIAPKSWNESTLVTVSYGYGLATSLMHITQSTAAIINGGYFFDATLIPNRHTAGQTVLSHEHSRKIRELMYLAVHKGTGRRAKVHGYEIGGKTGSAEKIVKGIYDKNRNISSFIAIFPVKRPRYVVAIMVDEPDPKAKRHTTGGMVAAPVAAAVIEKIALILNVVPKDNVNPKTPEKNK